MLLNYHIGRFVLDLMCVGVRVQFGPDTTLAKPHPNSNTRQIENKTANVVVQQHSCKVLKMGILMPKIF